MSRADDESDDEKQKTKNNLVGEEENPDLENEENHQKSNSFVKGPSASVRTFDGLSVIDEQTEETQTTTESPIVYGGPSSSRGNSGSRNYLPGLYDDDDDVEDTTCGMTHLEEGYGPGIYNNPLKSPVKKKGSCLYEDNVSPYAPGGGNWNANCENFESRPASPYPYNGIHHHRDSYQKRFQVLQNLSMAQSSPNNHPLCDNEWIFTTNSQPPSEDLHNYVDGKSDAPPIKSNSLYHPSSSTTTTFGYNNIFQDRTGPDVFVTNGIPSTTTTTTTDIEQQQQQHFQLLPESKENFSTLENLDTKLVSIIIIIINFFPPPENIPFHFFN